MSTTIQIPVQNLARAMFGTLSPNRCARILQKVAGQITSKSLEKAIKESTTAKEFAKIIKTACK